MHIHTGIWACKCETLRDPGFDVLWDVAQGTVWVGWAFTKSNPQVTLAIAPVLWSSCVRKVREGCKIFLRVGHSVCILDLLGLFWEGAREILLSLLQG